MVSLRWFDDQEPSGADEADRRRKESARRDAVRGRKAAVKAWGAYDVADEPGPDAASTTTPPPAYGPVRRLPRLPR